MTAQNWMIGDWTYYTEQRYQDKIIALDSLNHLVGFRKSHLSIDWCDMDECSPIPLTPEILEANGFRESIEEGTYYFPDKYSDINNRGFAIETDGDGVWFITDHQLMPFRYVHELQRVLRCCGMTDIADNFKLEKRL